MDTDSTSEIQQSDESKLRVTTKKRFEDFLRDMIQEYKSLSFKIPFAQLLVKTDMSNITANHALEYYQEHGLINTIKTGRSREITVNDTFAKELDPTFFLNETPEKAKEILSLTDQVTKDNEPAKGADVDLPNHPEVPEIFESIEEQNVRNRDGQFTLESIALIVRNELASSKEIMELNIVIDRLKQLLRAQEITIGVMRDQITDLELKIKG